MIAWLSRRPFWAFSLLSLVFWAFALLIASRKPFFFDEICAVSLAQLPTFGAIWQRIGEGLELNPPGYFFLLSLIRLPGDPHILYRIPSIFGAWLFALCVFDILRRRVRPSLALCCVALPLFTSAVHHIAEARAYGLILGIGALAFWAWMRAENWILLAATAWMLVGLHYYAPYYLVAIGVGELIRTRRSGWRAGPWLALGSAALPLLALVPLIRLHRQSTGAFWSGVQVRYLFITYSEVFCAGGLLLAVVMVISACSASRERSSNQSGFRSEEVWAAFVLLLMPVVAFVLALAVTHAYTTRYLFPTLLGATLLTGCALSRLSHGSERFDQRLVGFVMAATGLWASGQVIMLPTTPAPADAARASWSPSPGNEPIAVASQLCFLELYQYAPVTVRDRLVYLSDIPAAREIQGAETPDRSLAVLARFRPLPLYDLAAFRKANPEFLVLSSNHATWLVEKLLQQRAHLTVVNHQFLNYCGADQGADEFSGYSSLIRVTP